MYFLSYWIFDFIFIFTAFISLQTQFFLINIKSDPFTLLQRSSAPGAVRADSGLIGGYWALMESHWFAAGLMARANSPISTDREPPLIGRRLNEIRAQKTLMDANTFNLRWAKMSVPRLWNYRFHIITAYLPQYRIVWNRWVDGFWSTKAYISLNMLQKSVQIQLR